MTRSSRLALRRPSETPPQPTSIHAVFIANRGEIARRIARTCDRLGIRAVTPVDGRSRRARPARWARRRRRGPRRRRRRPPSGVRVPGRERRVRRRWSRRPGSAGSGRPPAAIRAMGDKAAARRLAASLGIPVLPGYDGPGQGDRALARRRSATGFPLIVKPAAGGGGKGMRVVREQDRLVDALAAARREAIGRVRRRPAHPRAPRRGRPPCRGPGPVRRARRRRPPRRARLLDPAASPEGARGVAVARGRRPACGQPRRVGADARAGGRLRERGHVRVPRRRPRRPVLPRDEHAAPGRASRHRARDRARPRRRPAADRGRRTARLRCRRRAADRPRGRGPALCRGCRGRLPAGDGPDRASALAGRRGDPGRRRDRAGKRHRRPLRPDAGEDRRVGTGPAGCLRSTGGGPRRDRRPRRRHEPPVPALARPPAGRAGRARLAPTRSSASGRRTTGLPAPRSRTRPGERPPPTRSRPASRPTRGPAAGGSTRRGS